MKTTLMRTTTSTPGKRMTIAFVAVAALAVSATYTEQQIEDQWPVVFVSGNDQVQVFTPQPEKIDGDHFSARFAVAIQRPSDADPIFGAVWGNGVLAIDRSTRLGELTSFTVTDVRFPGVDDAAEQERIKKMLGSELPKHTAPVAIDWLIASLESEQQGTATYQNDPPEIIYTEKPSVLVYIDGEPQYTAVTANTKTDDRSADPNYPVAAPRDVERVVNTPFLLVRPKNGAHYLYGSGMWFTSKEITGKWVRTYDVPKDISAIAAQVDSTSAIAATKADGSTTTPEIVVRRKPAVLLDLDGAPNFQPLPNTALLYATNTDDDLFLDVASQDNYLLASGRWFATRTLKTGPWRFVPADQLPAEFAKIPEGSAKDGALAHVPGTAAAREAVRDASIPQTAKIDRRTAALTVTYDGDPQFERITGTQVENALNASTTVLRINGTYHALDNAVWFEGPSPDGPWTVSTEVPAEVNTIPPSSSAYNTRYVYIYDSTPDVVYMGYTPGYYGTYVQAGIVIYGTGFYYNAWPNRWYPRPFTYGFGMHYNPWAGWGYGGGWGWNWYYPSWYGYGAYGGYGGYYHPYGYGNGYNNYYGCGNGWWGPQGYYPPVVNDRSAHYGHRPSLGSTARAGVERTGATVRRPASDLYANRAEQGVRSTTVGRTPSKPTERPITKTDVGRMQPSSNDHFTDRAGNVYRKDESGNTDKYTNGRWEKLPADKPSMTTPATRDDRTTSPRPQQPEKPTTKPTRPVDPRTTTPQQPVRPTTPARTPEVDPRTTQPQQPERPILPARVPEVDPRTIQEQRSRGDQRVIDFNRSRNEQQQTRPSTPPSRTGTPGKPAPTRNVSPSKSSPSRTSPSRPSPSRPAPAPRSPAPTPRRK